MKKIKALSLFLLVLTGCYQNHIPGNIQAIKVVMEKQTQCWNNGDIDGFMDGYWKSDSLRFLGKRGLTVGWQKTLDNYKISYPNRNAMGKLIFTHILFEPLSDEQMFVVGKWALERETDTLKGHYSLLWKKIDGQWKVIFDHSS